MTAPLHNQPNTISGNAPRLEAHERLRIRTAAQHARTVYPGDLGELLYRELIAYAEFGFRFSTDALVPRLAIQILARHSARTEVRALVDQLVRTPGEARAEAS